MNLSLLCTSLSISSLLVQVLSHEVYHHHHYPDGKHIIYHETTPHAATCVAPATLPLKHHPSLISKILALAKEYLTSSTHPVSLFKPTPMEEVHTDPSKIPHYFHFHEHVDFSHDLKDHHGHKHEHHHGSKEEHHDHHDGHKEEHHEEHHSHDDHDDGHESKRLQQIHEEAAKRKIYLTLLNSKIKILSSDAMKSASTPHNMSNFEVTIKDPPERGQATTETTPKPMVLVPIYSKRLEALPSDGRAKSDQGSATSKQSDNNSILQPIYKFPPPQPYLREPKVQSSQEQQTAPYSENSLVDSPEFPFPVSNAEDVVSLMHQKTPVRTTNELLGHQVYSKNHFDSHESTRIDTWYATHKGNLQQGVNQNSSSTSSSASSSPSSSASLLKNHQPESNEVPLLQLNHSQISSNKTTSD